MVATGAVIYLTSMLVVMILNNDVGRCWSRYYTKQYSYAVTLLYVTTWLVATGAVIIINNMVGRFWGR